MADKAGSALSRLLQRLPFKMPWQVTGVASSPEFASYLPPATEYRRHAPGSQPVKAVVPHARPERIYDIKYWPRDERRAGQVVGGTNKRFVEETKYDVTALDDKFDAAPVFSVGKPHKWGKKVPLLEYPNNGYTT